MTVHGYLAYGLGIHSALRLGELPCASVSEDVVVRMGRVGAIESADYDGCMVRAHGDTVVLQWKKTGRFLVRAGREVVIEPVSGVDPALLALPLQGAVLAVMLQQRGFLVLHGSASLVGGAGVVFLGAKGEGKSSMVAALSRRGHALMADDVVAIARGDDGSPTILAGFPMIRLWPDSVVNALGEDPAYLAKVAECVEKRVKIMAERSSREPEPLTRIYVLAEGPEARLLPLGPSTTMKELICHSYTARFGNALLQGAAAAEHLRLCSLLPARVQAATLERDRSGFDSLRKSVEVVERDLA